jgi:hypothetical protein
MSTLGEAGEITNTAIQNQMKLAKKDFFPDFEGRQKVVFRKYS